MKRRLCGVLVLLGHLVCAGCGGGGGSGGSANTPSPAPVVVEITPFDAVPGTRHSEFNAAQKLVTIRHQGYVDFVFENRSACSAFATTSWAARDLSDSELDAFFEHSLICDFAENQNQDITVRATRNNGDLYSSTSTVRAGVASGLTRVVQDTVVLPSTQVVAAISAYLAQELVADLNLPLALLPILQPTLQNLTASAWPELANPLTEFDVQTERVSYTSQDPSGNTSQDLSGLVAVPRVGTGFVPKDRVIVLLHSTGVTPSELDPTDAWYLLASVLASRGYVVVAADNWGRGNTAAEPETYLQGRRTALNTWDLLQAVLSSADYAGLLVANPNVTAIGYSQGGHSGLAFWRLVEENADAGVVVDEVYLGGGPYDLYATFNGVVEAVAGTCAGGPYCNLVGEDVAVPFATERILPGYFAYLDTALTSGEVVTGNQLSNDFVDGFLANDARFDRLKLLLQSNSQFQSAAATDNNNTRFVTYHSNFDRLVPVANQTALVSSLGALPIEDRSAVCNTADLQTLFGLTDQVGVIHALCGIAMIDDVLLSLR